MIPLATDIFILQHLLKACFMPRIIVHEASVWASLTSDTSCSSPACLTPSSAPQQRSPILLCCWFALCRALPMTYQSARPTQSIICCSSKLALWVWPPLLLPRRRTISSPAWIYCHWHGCLLCGCLVFFFLHGAVEFYNSNKW